MFNMCICIMHYICMCICISIFPVWCKITDFVANFIWAKTVNIWFAWHPDFGAFLACFGRSKYYSLFISYLILLVICIHYGATTTFTGKRLHALAISVACGRKIISVYIWKLKKVPTYLTFLQMLMGTLDWSSGWQQ